MYTLQVNRLGILTEGPTSEEQAIAGAHWAYSTELLAKGVILFGGRTMIPSAESFALVVVRAESEAEARACMENDPAVKAGMFRGKLWPFQPMLMGEWPSELSAG
jgi:uncharacterized protein YciI